MSAIAIPTMLSARALSAIGMAASAAEEPSAAVPFSEQPVIRVVILSGLAAIGYLVFLRRNRLPFHIVTVFALLAAGAAAVMFPGATDDIAHYVGVGRGVDLITYILELAVIYVLIHYYTKFVELQRQQTQLTREMAILKAELERRAPEQTSERLAPEQRAQSQQLPPPPVDTAPGAGD